MDTSTEITKVRKMLEDHEKRLSLLEAHDKERAEFRVKKEDLGIEKKLEKLALDLKIDRKLIENVITVGVDDVDLRINITGKNEKERQFNGTVSILTVYHYTLSKNQIDSNELMKKLTWLGIGSLGNLSKNMKSYKRYLVMKGKPSSSKFTYGVTSPGIKKGLEIISDSFSK